VGTNIDINLSLTRRLLSAAIACMLLAACGQKAGVADLPAPGPASADQTPSAAELEAAASSLETGSPSMGTADLGTGHSGSTETATGEEPDLTTIDASPGSDVGAQVDELLRGDRPPPGGSTVGITNDTIHLAMHFPVTGSSPNPYTAVSDYNIYWDHLRAKGESIAGRSVTMRARDDRSTPSAARDVCRDMAETDPRAFVLLGFAGPGQIQACAHYAMQQGIPYLAPGSSRYPLENMATHFSLSAPYTDQAPLIGRILRDRFGAEDQKNGWIRSSGGNDGDLRTAQAVFASQGLEFESIYTVNAEANYQELEGVVLDMKGRGIENVYFGGTPTHFIYFWQAARTNGFRPQLTGPGFTVTADGPLHAACSYDGAPNGSLFLSPYPAFSERGKWDPEYSEAVAKLDTRYDNELNWWIWNLSRSVEKLLRLPGRNLTRERLLWFATHAPRIETGLMPPLDYAPNDHFTDESIHMLKARCDRGTSRWVGAGSFLSL
jgi:ABC-type branched-subunit amino acid transport system substrate-binding protein